MCFFEGVAIQKNRRGAFALNTTRIPWKDTE
jgi:hypothetical protein